VGNHNIFSGYAAAAGHCEIGNWVIVSGCAALHQFVRVGDHAMVGGMAKVVQDIAPYMIAEGSPACLRSVNQVGLSRRGFSEEDIRAIRFAYRKLFLYKEDKTKLEDKLAEEDILPRRTEGVRESRWIVLDYANVIVHIFHPEEREYYNIERLWLDGSNQIATDFQD
jgi:acyl-ACP--UDP-N-acetylglucosamine O-acyltransferase